MKLKNIPVDIRAKSIKEAQNEIKQSTLHKNKKNLLKDLE